MRNTLKVLRAQKNLTQDQLAKAVQVSRQTINAIEKEKFDPSLILAIKLARLFEKEVEEIFIYEKS